MPCAFWLESMLLLSSIQTNCQALDEALGDSVASSECFQSEQVKHYITCGNFEGTRADEVLDCRATGRCKQGNCNRTVCVSLIKAAATVSEQPGVQRHGSCTDPEPICCCNNRNPHAPAEHAEVQEDDASG